MQNSNKQIITGVDNSFCYSSYLDALRSEIFSARSSAEALVRQADAWLEELDEYSAIDKRRPGDEEVIAELAGRTVDITQEFEAASSKCCFKLYSNLCQPVAMLSRPYSVAEHEDFERVGEGLFGIQTAIENDSIYVKMPMLGRPVAWFGRNQSGGVFAQNYSKLYAYHVRLAMERHVLGNINEEDFVNKTLTFVFVYSSSAKWPLDSTAHDVKATIDALTCFLPGGDSAYCCDVSFFSKLTDDVPAGTYIKIAKGRTNHLDHTCFNEICSVFSEKDAESCSTPR